MSERLHAVFASLCVLTGCFTIGDLLIGRSLSRRAPADVVLLSSGGFGLGVVAVATAIIGAAVGFSARVLAPFWYVLFVASVIWLFVRRRVTPADHSTREPVNLLSIAMFLLLAYHIVAFLLVGLTYPLGSDSFTYLLIPQTFLRTGTYIVPPLEPLGEPMPFFNAPFAFELIYLHVLALSNLIGPVLIAKLMFPITCALVLVIGRRLAGSDAGLFALGVLLVQPFLLYFFSESLDNYFIAVCFELLAYYFLWQSYESGKRSDLLLAGSFLGFMVAVKETTIYYMAAILLLFPILVIFKRRNSSADRLTAKRFAIALVHLIGPAILIAAIFPAILAIKTGALPYGGSLVAERLGIASVKSWYEPMVSLGYSGGYTKFVRYASDYGHSAFPPESLVRQTILLKDYLNNPFQPSISGRMTANSLSPIALLVNLIVFPALFYLFARGRTMLLWSAATLWLAYAAKLISYPFLDPPKSEIFQIVPTALLLGIALHLRGWRRTLQVLTFCLLVFGAINALRTYKTYSSTIDRYSGASIDEVAESFRQKWYRNHLHSSDVVFGRLMNECTYIDQGRCIPFFWRALYFLPWPTIQNRIEALGVTVLYDSTSPPSVLMDPSVAPLARRTDPALCRTVETMEAMYRANYKAKETYLSEHFARETSDGYGVIYVRK